MASLTKLLDELRTDEPAASDDDDLDRVRRKPPLVSVVVQDATDTLSSIIHPRVRRAGRDDQQDHAT
jgi:hypothetical protein